MTTHWTGKRVLIIGAARQGIALARYLAAHGAQAVVNDIRPAPELEAARTSLADVPVEWVLGGHPPALLDGAHLVCPSGGVPLDLPLIAEAVRRGLALSNDSQIFLEACPCRVCGITGSAGKTTTTTLVGRMAQAAIRQPGEPTQQRSVFVGGNIGNPLIALVDEMKPDDLAIMELSSFQLELMTRSPQVAAVLNITPNHLDRHPTLEAYTQAKANILRFQEAGDVAVLGREDAGAWSLARLVRGRLITFGRAAAGGRIPVPGWAADVHLQGEEIVIWDGRHRRGVLPRAEVLLRGEHNLLNVLAACAIAYALELPVEAMRAGVQGFRGVPHRLEFVRSVRGADWYNDSIATAPERAMAGMLAFDEPLVLLAGGRDKKLPWDDFARLVCQRVDHLVLFGESAGMIAGVVRKFQEGGRPFTVACCSGLQEAVQAAAQVAREGDVVLLSPGGASFDEFRDFEMRGERFKQWVWELVSR